MVKIVLALRGLLALAISAWLVILTLWCVGACLGVVRIGYCMVAGCLT